MIAGAIARHPLGGAGNTWAFLQYVLGFERLGFETYYVEHLSKEECFDEHWQPAPFSASVNARYFRFVAARFGFTERASLLQQDGPGHVGLSRAEVEKLAPEVDLFVNLSGRFHLQPVLARVHRRLYLDLDPGFTQIWQARYGVDMNFRGHDRHVTVGLNLGRPDCPLPTCGISWETTLPPVVLSEWATTRTPGSAYSTVADWRGYSPVEWNGAWYGQKADELMRLKELPRRLPVALEICLAIHPEEPGRLELEQHGWRLVSPREHAATPDAYRDYIQASRAELTAVKHGYAAGRTGWFSDRSACYLAAGRPVVTQSTGIEAHLPTGSGLLTFNNLEGAAAAISAVEAAYAAHADAASAFAREYLDSDRVLARLWELAQ